MRIKAKILCIDDEPAIREIISDILSENEGYEVITSSGGHEAMTLLEDESWDIIIVDFHMPILSGAALINKFRTGMDSEANIPIIFLSAFVEDARLSVLDRDNILFLDKPILFKNLVEAIESLLNNEQY